MSNWDKEIEFAEALFPTLEEGSKVGFDSEMDWYVIKPSTPEGKALYFDKDGATFEATLFDGFPGPSIFESLEEFAKYNEGAKKRKADLLSDRP